MGMTFSAKEVAGGNTGIRISGGGLTAPANSSNFLQNTSDPTTISSGNVLGSGTSTRNGNNYAPAPVQAAPKPAPKPVLNQAAVDNTQGSIDALAGILQRALDAENQKYTDAETLFNEQQAGEQGRYDKGTETNQLNYDSNLMASLRAGAKGLGGLLSILRGTGAEGWANDAVRDTTSSDIRTGLDNRNENQTSLDNGIGSFLGELAGKRRDNEATRQNNEFAHRGNNASEAQRLYKEMAGFYSDAEDTGNATRLMNKAGEYTPEIAKYSVAPVRGYDASPVKVQAAPVTAFSGAAEQNVNYDGGNNSNNGIFTINNTRKKLAGVGA
jgi:hypothetical protein